jgi:hypothetical protein
VGAGKRGRRCGFFFVSLKEFSSVEGRKYTCGAHLDEPARLVAGSNLPVVIRNSKAFVSCAAAFPDMLFLRLFTFSYV